MWGSDYCASVVQNSFMTQTYDLSACIKLLGHCGLSLGSSRSLTSRMPCSMSSHFPSLDRSSLFNTLWLRLPSAAAFVANSTSLAFAAIIVSFELANARWIEVRASLRAWADKTARLREDIEAALATSRGDKAVTDISFVRYEVGQESSGFGFRKDSDEYDI